MVVSTFPVWAAILLFGMIALFLAGWTNVYVPKDQREKAKRIGIGKIRMSESATIRYELRVKGTWYVLMPTLVVLVASIVFFMNDFSVLARSIMPGTGGVVLAVLIYIVQLFIVEMILIVMPFLGETMSVKETQSYYKNRYGVEVVDPKPD